MLPLSLALASADAPHRDIGTALATAVCGLRVDLLLKTDSEYPRDAEVALFTLATPGSSLRF